MQAVHEREPDGKFIIFSEYTDTVDWLVEFLSGRGYEGKIGRFVGGLSGPERKAALSDFTKPEKLLLVTTDAVRNVMRNRGTFHLRNVITTGVRYGMRSMKTSLDELLDEGVIQEGVYNRIIANYA